MPRLGASELVRWVGIEVGGVHQERARGFCRLMTCILCISVYGETLSMGMKGKCVVVNFVRGFVCSLTVAE